MFGKLWLEVSICSIKQADRAKLFFFFNPLKVCFDFVQEEDLEAFSYPILFSCNCNTLSRIFFFN